MTKTLLFIYALLSCAALQAQSSLPLTLARTIALPGITGKFDHFAIDLTNKRLFVAASASHAVELIDLPTGKITQSLTGLGKPHGLAWIEGTARLFVADGDKGELAIYEGSPLKRIATIKLSQDADDMVYDAATKLLYVGHGGTDAANPAAIAVIDAVSMVKVTDLPTAAHPEALELDASTGRVFANISDTGEIVVIDGKTHKVADKWTLSGAKGNTPLAFDKAHHLLLVGCRTPAKLLSLSGETGRQTDAADSDAGADDLFYDEALGRAYLIAGSGALNSYAVASNGSLTALTSVQTSQGAKTGLFVPELASLFLGVPSTSGQSEIRVYKTGSR